MRGEIPVSVVVLTKNEAPRIAKCLQALAGFDEVVVVDSHSDDDTVNIALSYGARVEEFSWNGRYPKKRQWCLDHLSLKHDHVFFVDADEIVTPEVAEEIAALDWKCAGYFVRAHYVIDGKILRFGLCNAKLCLLDRNKFMHPSLDDLGCPDMGEIEGHYQPQLKADFALECIGVLRSKMLHESCSDWAEWEARHQRYARWEAYMDTHQLWPGEVSARRKFLKRVFKILPCRPLVAFVHSYILKLGFLDGRAGWKLAASRARYYRMINAALASSTRTGPGGAASN